MYFNISLSSEPNVIGVSNGIYQAEYDETAFNSQTEHEYFTSYFKRNNYLNQVDKLKDVNIPITRLNLLKKAKITDFMGFAPGILSVQFIISEKAKNLLSHFKLQPLKFFETALYDDKTKIEKKYFFLYIPYIEKEFINFEKSEMKKILNIYEKKYFKVNSYEHYRELQTKGVFDFSEISLKKKYENLDLIHPYTGNLYISEALKDAIEAEELTGLDIIHNCDLKFEE